MHMTDWYGGLLPVRDFIDTPGGADVAVAQQLEQALPWPDLGAPVRR